MHIYSIQPRFSDYDMFGHVNNGAYLQYLDLAKSMFFGEITGRPFSPESVSSVIVNINVNFTAPTVPGEPIDVETSVARIGERSYAISQRVINPETGVAKCDAVTTLAGFDYRTQSSAPLPEILLQGLRKHLHEP